MDEDNIKEYTKLIEKANPDFIHVKGFMSVGYSRERAGYDKMPWFKEVKEYALNVLKNLEEYELAGEDERCCVVLIAKKGKKLKIEKIKQAKKILVSHTL